MPELRRDPISGRAVFIAEERAGRPTDYGALEIGAQDKSQGLSHASEAADGDCPFCAGNESATPHQSAVIRDDAGQWQVRVVPNKYPALATLPAPSPSWGGLGRGEQLVHGTSTPPHPGERDGRTSGCFGAHEVIIESPLHAADFHQLDVAQLARVVRMYRDRARHWAADGRLAHVLVFKNSGFAAGASLAHVHSQLVALPFVPDAVQLELDGAARHYAATGRCAFCDLIAAEIASGERLVLQERGFLAVCAVAGRQPLETWILPESHSARFDDIDDDACRDLAALLRRLLNKLDAVLPRAAYNLILHSGPFDGSHDADFHWHWELLPRQTHLAGLELGGGAFINPLAPERAAEKLRGAAG